MRILFLSFILFTFLFSSDKVSVFKVEKMHCPICTIAVKKAVKKLYEVRKVSVRLNTKKVKVIHSEKIIADDILKAIKTTSYEGILLSTKNID